MRGAGPPLDDDLRRLLGEEGRLDTVSPESLERARARLALSVLTAGVAIGSASRLASAASAAKHGITLSAAKLGAVVALSFGVGVGAGLAVPRSPHASVSAAPGTSVSAPVVTVGERPLPPPVPAPPEPSVEDVAPSAPPRVRAPAPQTPPASSGQKASERVLLDQARRSLQEGDAERALALTERHEHDFPTAVLGEERDVIRIGALAALGRADESRSRAAAFERRYPGSPFAPAVASQLRALDRRDE